jgi:general secretion pathway protein I
MNLLHLSRRTSLLRRFKEISAPRYLPPFRKGGQGGFEVAGKSPSIPLLQREKNASLQSGFTLLEVLVALAILAITMAAVSRTASSSIHHVEAVRTRVIADWVAQNRLAQHQARADWPAPGIQTGEETQAGQTYPWQEEIIATPNPTMRRIVVSVYAPDDAKHSLRELTGYLVQYSR